MSALFPHAIFVTFLTGFLGSGKTTALNALLRDGRLRDTAVIVNEFGEVGLDHLLISQADENVVLLDSGCICCTIGNGLVDTLETLYRHRLQARVPNFSRIVVETTGLADPVPMLKLVIADKFVAKHFAINGVLTTVDGVNGLEQILDHSEARNQVALASHVLLTKTDLCAPETVDVLKSSVRSLNATAAVSRSKEVAPGVVDLPHGVFDFIYANADSNNLLDLQLSGPDNEEPAPIRSGPLGPFNHDARIDSHAYFWNESIPWEKYSMWLEKLRRIPPQDLLRVKGLLELGEYRKPYVIQGVQHVFAAPARLSSWPSTDHRSRLVVIARGVQKDALNEIFSN
ncbi:GTP-binding protein [Variovorax sp. dw_308]|uniref:CobW family GTP-binding protein n=1 Tax=Variovorax sp. dw_308 TaxID=2721546 RepID=UPI001C445E8E|nr:GTP-binding protein [Variovorax sp. dw_308]